MSHMDFHFDRVRRIADEIKRLEDGLMGNKIIPVSEQGKIHAEIQRLKKERDELEKRTR